MDIYFKTNKMKKLCSTQTLMTRKWGPQLSRKLMQRLSEIKASESIGELQLLPQARCHELAGSRKEQFAVDLKHPYRLIFEPHHKPIPLNNNGGFDIWNITAVTVLEVKDYHG